MRKNKLEYLNSLKYKIQVTEKNGKFYLYIPELSIVEENENLEDAVEVATTTEFSEEKANNIVRGISAMLKYLDDNESYDHILQIQNYISDLENYGFETESIVETLRKQSNNSINKDLYGCWVADNSTKLTANTMAELKTQFANKYKIAI